MVTWELTVFGLSVAPEVGVASVSVASSETASSPETASVYYIIERRVCSTAGNVSYITLLSLMGFLNVFLKCDSSKISLYPDYAPLHIFHRNEYCSFCTLG